MVPRIVRVRRLRWGLAWFGVVVAAAAPALYYGQLRLAGVVLSAGALGTAVVAWLCRLSLRRYLDTYGARVCPRCTYSLQGLSDEGRCPECGYPYDVAEVERELRRWA